MALPKQNFDPATGIFEVIPNGYIEDLNGFSATAFRNRVTGEITVSFRGTDTLVDMVNFYLRLA